MSACAPLSVGAVRVCTFLCVSVCVSERVHGVCTLRCVCSVCVVSVLSRCVVCSYRKILTFSALKRKCLWSLGLFHHCCHDMLVVRQEVEHAHVCPNVGPKQSPRWPLFWVTDFAPLQMGRRHKVEEVKETFDMDGLKLHEL